MGCPTQCILGENLTFTEQVKYFGEPIDADGNVSYSVYEDETGTAILSGTMTKLDDAGITVVEQPERREVAVGASDKQLGKAFGRVIDTALHTLASGVERRMVIRSRKANRGVVVEIEYTSGSLKGTGAANIGGTSPDVRELAAYRRCFAEFAIAVLLQLKGKFLAPGAHDTAISQHVNEIGHDVIQQTLIVGNNQHGIV